MQRNEHRVAWAVGRASRKGMAEREGGKTWGLGRGGGSLVPSILCLAGELNRILVLIGKARATITDQRGC